MSIKWINMVWQESEYDYGKRLVLLSLADNANDEGVCWPSIETIAKRCKLSERQVQRIIKGFVADGVVEKNERNGRSNVFQLLGVNNVRGDICDIVDDKGVTSVTEGVTPTSPRTIINTTIINKKEPQASLSEKSNSIFDEYREEWNRLFPDKPKLMAVNSGVREKIKAALKKYGKPLEENWKKALYNASLSPHLHNESWFHSGWLWLQNKNGANWEKCINFYFDSQDLQHYGYKGSEGKKRSGLDDILAAEGLL